MAATGSCFVASGSATFVTHHEFDLGMRISRCSAVGSGEPATAKRAPLEASVSICSCSATESGPWWILGINAPDRSPPGWATRHKSSVVSCGLCGAGFDESGLVGEDDGLEPVADGHP